MDIIEFKIPTKIIFGANSLDSLTDIIKKYGGRAIIVTDGSSFNQIGLIDRIVGKLNENFINTNEAKNIKISFDAFLIKVKAELIELLWNDNCQNNIPFLKKIIENNPGEITNSFFPINRKCRDNIHYGFYNELTSTELNILNKYQDVYLNYVIKEFEKELKIKFGVGYKIGLALAKLQYWASN